MAARTNGRSRRLSALDWADLGLAGLELALARWRLKDLDVRTFRPEPAESGSLTPKTAALSHDDVNGQIGRVARAIGRAGAVVPWRADCLVRAEAARHWLARKGFAPVIRLGARKTADGHLDAHAWAICEGQVVTGGDIRDYVPFAQPPGRGPLRQED